MKLVKIPHSSDCYVNPECIAFIKEDTDRTCTREYARIIFKDGNEKTVYCSPKELADAIGDDESIAEAIRDTFSPAFGRNNSAPAFLEAIAMALGYDNGDGLERIASALQGIAESIGDCKTSN